MEIRVLYLVNSTIMGGATISFLKMISGLKGKGVEAYVVLPNHDILLERRLESLGAHPFVRCLVMSILPARPKGILQSLLYCVRYPIRYIKRFCLREISYRSVQRLVADIKPDIIHSNSGVIHEGFRCSQYYSIPHVWHLREYQCLDFNWDIFPTRKKFEGYLRESNVITITDDIRRYFHLEGYHRACTIYNGIFKKSEACYIDDRKEYFLCASRISPEKGHDDVIIAFSKFCNTYTNYRLCILGFGDDNYIKHLNQAAQVLGCDDKIDWIGFKEDVKPYLKEAKALIVASHFEGFGRMTAESCFMGCMVIGRNTGGTKEILDRTGGELFETTDELLEKMYKVAVMPKEQYNKKVSFAQKVAVDLYSEESNVNRIANLYKNLLEHEN